MGFHSFNHKKALIDHELRYTYQNRFDISHFLSKQRLMFFLLKYLYLCNFL